MFHLNIIIIQAILQLKKINRKKSSIISNNRKNLMTSNIFFSQKAPFQHICSKKANKKMRFLRITKKKVVDQFQIRLETIKVHKVVEIKQN